ncbi:MAG: protease inhibitor I42 family protein [Myxococcales bacterium]|nr:protease inhibitor I42 family protein [Myxococcales bacterium]
MRISFVALAVAVSVSSLGGLVACGGSSSEAELSQDELNRQSSVVEIDEDDNKKTISVEKGKAIKLRLASPGSGGYKWKVVSTDRSFGYPTPKDGEFESSGGGRAGGGGTQVFTWDTDSRLLTPGGANHAVKLEYRRPWEDDSVAAAETFSFKVKITEPAHEPPAPDLKPIVVEADDDGDRVKAKEGQDVVVKLPANASAGYRWHVESVDRTLGQPEVSYEANNPRAVGGGGLSVLTWKTGPAGPLSKVGTHAIKLKYSRGASGEAEKEFSFTLLIAAVAEEDEFECPTQRSINCMPPITPARRANCAADFRAWAESHCDVTFLH